MRSEKSCGAIVFRLEEGKPIYLLLFGPTYWGFVKGLSEKGESEEETTLREAEEETGMKIRLLYGFKERIEYTYKFDGELIKTEVKSFEAHTFCVSYHSSEPRSIKRVLKFEHELYSQVLRDINKGVIRLEDHKPFP